MSTEIVIASAVRTAIGSFNGALSNLPATHLGALCIKEALKRAKLNSKDVDQAIMGHVLSAACGQGPARQAAVEAGIPHDKTAYSLNQVCGSGLRAVANAYAAIRSGDARIVVAGGMESMSLSPHCVQMRKGVKMGDTSLIDSMIRDGLWDAFNEYHMGITAENVAKKFDISRQQQDEFAVASQQKAEAATKEDRFKGEILPITIKDRKGEIKVEQDEGIRAGTTLEALAKLKPAFAQEGSVTAGNSSNLNDGAAALIVMSAEDAAKRGITPLARIASWATCGVDPAVMGTGPIPSSKLALERAGWKVDDLDLIEANEAFAAQAIAVNKEMGWDPAKVNVNGGAIALGHPIGASGARVLTTLLYEMQKRDAKKGLATLCIGGGMGIALCVER